MKIKKRKFSINKKDIKITFFYRNKVQQPHAYTKKCLNF